MRGHHGHLEFTRKPESVCLRERRESTTRACLGLIIPNPGTLRCGAFRVLLLTGTVLAGGGGRGRGDGHLHLVQTPSTWGSGTADSHSAGPRSGFCTGALQLPWAQGALGTTRVSENGSGDGARTRSAGAVISECTRGHRVSHPAPPPKTVSEPSLRGQV